MNSAWKSQDAESLEVVYYYIAYYVCDAGRSGNDYDQRLFVLCLSSDELLVN